MATTKTFEFVHRLKGDANAVWSTLAAVGGVDRWLPIITVCRVEGQGPGARRYCETADGASLSERIIEIDHDRRRFAYVIEKGLPVDRYAGVFEIREEPDGGQSLVWSVEATGEAEGLEQIEAMLTQVVPLGFEGLESIVAVAQ